MAQDPRILIEDRCEYGVKFPNAVSPAAARTRYMAYIEGNRGKWDCGPSPEAAVRALHRTWPESVGLLLAECPTTPQDG